MNKLKLGKKFRVSLCEFWRLKKINKLYFCCVIFLFGKYVFFDFDINYCEIIGFRDNI